MFDLNKIGIIGAGAIGRAVGKRLEAQNVSVEYWDVDRTHTTALSLDDLVLRANVILICTPSSTNRVLAQEVLQATAGDTAPRAVISLAKGVEPGFRTVDAILKDVLGGRFVTGVLSGPMIASEIAEGHIAGVTIATTSNDVNRGLTALLRRAGFAAYSSADVSGVACCGALKNVYALALGLADGLSLGFNAKSTITVMAAEELAQLLKQFGHDPALAFGLAGLGDLLTTGYSGLSYNWNIGRKRALGAQSLKGEGINTLTNLVAVMPSQKLPLLHTLEAVFLEHADPIVLKSLLHSQAGTKPRPCAPISR